VGARFCAPAQTGPGAHPASCTMGTGSFPAVKRGRGVSLTTHPLLVPWSRKSRAITLLPLWAVRPVQSLGAMYKGALYLFTFYMVLKLRLKVLYRLLPFKSLTDWFCIPQVESVDCAVRTETLYKTRFVLKGLTSFITIFVGSVKSSRLFRSGY